MKIIDFDGLEIAVNPQPFSWKNIHTAIARCKLREKTVLGNLGSNGVYYYTKNFGPWLAFAQIQ